MTSIVAGPVLFARGSDSTRCRLAALVVRSASSHTRSSPGGSGLRPMGGEPVEPIELARLAEHVFLRYDFELPANAPAFYEFDGVPHAVETDTAGALRIAFASCNGMENGDAERVAHERNLMWRRLLAEHEGAPFALLLHGGDQLYADEASTAHPTLVAWAASALHERDHFAFDDEVERAALRFFVDRYLGLYTDPDVAALMARVPSAMIWDDHDIFDGWGSHPSAMLDSPVGQGLFGVAQRAFLLFQRALSPEVAMPGDSLSWSLSFPDLHVIAPDLRSERRMERVLGPAGWTLLADHLERARGTRRILLLSSVPLLGPRLSLFERLIGTLPVLRHYADDLRDQWQSRAHRDEWRRMLERLDAASLAGSEVTVLSGEIHLASRGEMPIGDARTLHQLIASGIAHPPPSSGWARALGWLATFGENPLPEQPIRLRPLPGQRGIYTAERNYLVLERDAGAWSATWECEESGRSGALALGGEPGDGAEDRCRAD